MTTGQPRFTNFTVFLDGLASEQAVRDAADVCNEVVALQFADHLVDVSPSVRAVYEFVDNRHLSSWHEAFTQLPKAASVWWEPTGKRDLESLSIHYTGLWGPELPAAVFDVKAVWSGRRNFVPALNSIMGIGERVTISFGEMGPAGGSAGLNSRLEHAIRGRIEPLAERVLAGRRTLRGYSWITVCPHEVIAQLGGVGALRDGGAFWSVSPSFAGGAVLQATRQIDDFDGDAINRVFSALRPALRGGNPDPRKAKFLALLR